MTHYVHLIQGDDNQRSVTLLCPDGVVAPVDRMVSVMEMYGTRSINTLVALCRDLKLWFDFLEKRGLAWDQVTWNGDDLLAHYLDWVRYGDRIDPAQRVIPLKPEAIRAETTVRRIMSSLYTFYDFHQATPFAKSMREYGASMGGRSTQLNRRIATRPVTLKPGHQEAPKTLTAPQLQQVKAACLSRRDLLLISLMADRGLRLGQVLGLRHEDWNSRLALLTVQPRTDNANGAHAKTDRAWPIPLTEELLDLHSEYLFDEYGDCPSDYLFVVLQGHTRWKPLDAGATRSIIQGICRRSGVHFHPHMLRHTFATQAIARGVPIGVVQAMLTHKNASTTTGTYTHLDAEDLRRWMDAAKIGGEERIMPKELNPSDPEVMRRMLDGLPVMK